MILKRLKCKNFFKYKDLDLRFSLGTTIICGKNGSGKSAITEAIKWGMFGQTSIGEKKIEGSVVELFLNIDSTLIKIRRTADKIEFGVDGKDYKKYRKVEAQSHLNKVLGLDIDFWDNFIYFNQNKSIKFIGGTGTDRYNLFKQIIDFSIIDRTHVVVVEKIRKLSFKIDSLENKIELLENKMNRPELATEIDVGDLRSEILFLEEKRAAIIKNNEKFLNFNYNWRLVRSRKKDLFSEHEDKYEDDKFIDFILKLNRVGILGYRKILYESEDLLKNLNEKIYVLNAKKQLLYKLKSGICPVCKSKVNKEDISRSIKSIEFKLNNEMLIYADKLERKILLFKKYCSLLSNEEFMLAVDNLNKNRSKKYCHKDVSIINDKIEKRKEKLAEINIMLKDIEYNKRQIEGFKERIEFYEGQRKIYNDIEPIFNYELKSEILRDAICLMEAEHNKAIIDMDASFPLRVKYTINVGKRKQESIDLKVLDIGGKEREIDKYSGGEKQRIMVAGFYALNRISKYLGRKSPDILILDEAFPFIDDEEDVITNICSLNIKQKIIITHNERLQGIGNKIYVEKINDKSKVRVNNDYG